MDKKQILDMIRRMAEADRGKSPGSQRFESETGVKKNDWYPKYWLRWGDAVREAGCESNLFSTSYDPEVLIRKYIDLIRELKNFPIEGQLIVKRKRDKTFPDRALSNDWGLSLNVQRGCLNTVGRMRDLKMSFHSVPRLSPSDH